MFGPFALYLVAINAAAFMAFAFDKQAALRRGRRVPERRLLALAALGGSPGALMAQDYPSRVYVDRQETMVDEEVGYRVSDVDVT